MLCAKYISGDWINKYFLSGAIIVSLRPLLVMIFTYFLAIPFISILVGILQHEPSDAIIQILSMYMMVSRSTGYF